ncbi:MAG: hypothetical protein WA140_01390 [Geobacteraceae bacterium]
MKCSCPKCDAGVELDLSQIPAEGISGKCPACNARYLISKESFVRRALRKAGEINCSNCGTALDHSLHCPSCWILFPDYFFAETPQTARKKILKILQAIKNLELSFKPTYTQSYRSERTTYAITPKHGVKYSKAFFIKATLVVLALFLAIGGGSYFIGLKAQRQYSANFFLALYVITAGTDLSLQTCSKLSTEWKTRMGRGQNVNPLISAEDEIRLNKIKGEVEKIMQKLNKPPRKFANIKNNLAKLNGIYLSSYSLALTPSDNISGLNDSANSLLNDFKQATQELKASLPKELAEDLPVAKAKYKSLRDI